MRIIFAYLLFFVGMSAFSNRASADQALPYDSGTDSLCFKNADPELATVGIPILGKLGVEQGVCQGIAGLTAAFLENAEFDHSRQSHYSPSEIHQIVRTLVDLHQSGVRHRFTISGYKNIKDFCEQNKVEMMRASILYNAKIAERDILPVALELFNLKKNNLRGIEDQRKLQTELKSIEYTLTHGRYPLMLYYKHVVMVTAFKEVVEASGDKSIFIDAYDSNHPDEIVTQAFSLENSGLPKVLNYMIWNLSSR